jgi:hypothetical protein
LQHECQRSVKEIQVLDFNEGAKDIRYNFVVGLLGIYEGRGWDYKSEIPGKGPIDLLNIGFFEESLKNLTTQTFNNILNKLIADGRKIGKISLEKPEIVSQGGILGDIFGNKSGV